LKTGLSLEEIFSAVKDEGSVLWIDLFDLDDNDIDLLTHAFSLHPLTIEDFIMPNARPKIEEFQDYLFLVIFTMQSGNEHKKNGKFGMTEIDCCLGNNFLITFHSEEINSISTCKERVKKQSPMIMHGADMLLYSILDSCVDNYAPVIHAFDNMVDEVSDDLFKAPSQNTLKKIYNLKNEIMHVRRLIGPQADVIGLLSRGTNKFIAQSNVMFFRNIFDNMARFNDIIGSSRDVIAGAMEAYTSIVSNRLNEVMKTLTIMATIMMPLTLLASIYGMNFKHMPELEHEFGYPIILITMFVIMISMLVFFKRKKWL